LSTLIVAAVTAAAWHISSVLFTSIYFQTQSLV